MRTIPSSKYSLFSELRGNGAVQVFMKLLIAVRINFLCGCLYKIVFQKLYEITYLCLVSLEGLEHCTLESMYFQQNGSANGNIRQLCTVKDNFSNYQSNRFYIRNLEIIIYAVSTGRPQVRSLQKTRK